MATKVKHGDNVYTVGEITELTEVQFSVRPPSEDRTFTDGGKKYRLVFSKKTFKDKKGKVTGIKYRRSVVRWGDTLSELREVLKDNGIVGHAQSAFTVSEQRRHWEYDKAVERFKQKYPHAKITI